MTIAEIRSSIITFCKWIVALAKANASGTEGRVVFMLAYGSCCMALYSLYKWNEEAAVILVLGYIAIAQTCVTQFFKHPSDDKSKRVIVEMLTVGYVCIGVVCLKLWNDKIGVEVLTGFMSFALMNSKEYFGLADSSTTTTSTATVSTSTTTTPTPEPPKAS